MTLYKIRDKNTGLFSCGGAYPNWSKKGKVWVALNYLNLHLNLVKNEYKNIHMYKDAEIVVFDVHESNSIDVNRFMGM